MGDTGASRKFAGLRLCCSANSRKSLANASRICSRICFPAGDEERPVLQLNASIAGIAHIVEHDLSFRSLVVPEIFRSILQYAILVARVDPDDPDANIWSDWLALAKAHSREADVPEVTDTTAIDGREAALAWIEAAVAGFAAQRGLEAATTYGRVMEASS